MLINSFSNNLINGRMSQSKNQSLLTLSINTKKIFYPKLKLLRAISKSS